MYTGVHAKSSPDRIAVIMAASGESLTYADLDARANRLAHAFRAHGLTRLDHYAIFMENHPRYLECCSAGERAGLFYTCVNSYLKEDELAYILQNSDSRILITSEKKIDIVERALDQCPNIQLCLVVDGPTRSEKIRNFEEVVNGLLETPIEDESLGSPMLYSSGTTGQPKGIVREPVDEHPSHEIPLSTFVATIWEFREGMIYLSPAPLYHSAPNAAVATVLRKGGTVIIMEQFDAENFLRFVEHYKVTHSQLVPTMFSRMLKLPDEARLKYDLSSLESTSHASAPCPIPIKEKMIEWWGPIIREYYSATEGLGFSLCTSEEWLAHKGTVGRVIFGDLHILDEAGTPCATGEIGTLWFKPAVQIEYYNDPEKTKDARSKDGKMTTVGDMGYLDEDGYLYLTDRKSFMIISGGVNIYPQECENLLIAHPKVSDAAVFGVPNEEFGEEVKVVIEMMPGEACDDAMAQELIAYCREHLANIKCPKSIDFIDEMPRLPTGKLYKTALRDKYWTGKDSRIL